MTSSPAGRSASTPGAEDSADVVTNKAGAALIASEPGGFLVPGKRFTRCRDCNCLVSLRMDGRTYRHEGTPESRERGTCRGSGRSIPSAQIKPGSQR